MKQIGKKIRIFAVAFLAALLIIVPSGCAGEEEKDALLAEFTALYEKSVEINEIIFGKGLPVDGEYTDIPESGSYYVPVSDDSPYKTVEELENAVLSVYTEDYYNSVLETTLFVGYGENKDSPYPRYKEEDGKLMINLCQEARTFAVKRLISEAKVEKMTMGAAEVSTPYELNGVRQDNLKSLTLYKTENGWRFDDPTY